MGISRYVRLCLHPCRSTQVTDSSQSICAIGLTHCARTVLLRLSRRPIADKADKTVQSRASVRFAMHSSAFCQLSAINATCGSMPRRVATDHSGRPLLGSEL